MSDFLTNRVPKFLCKLRLIDRLIYLVVLGLDFDDEIFYLFLLFGRCSFTELIKFFLLLGSTLFRRFSADEIINHHIELRLFLALGSPKKVVVLRF